MLVVGFRVFACFDPDFLVGVEEFVLDLLQHFRCDGGDVVLDFFLTFFAFAALLPRFVAWTGAMAGIADSTAVGIGFFFLDQDIAEVIHLPVVGIRLGRLFDQSVEPSRGFADQAAVLMLLSHLPSSAHL